jgi:predicted nucleic acid-binding protein
VPRYLLDTNILSELTKPRPSPEVVNWLRQQADETLYISTWTLAELWRGICRLPIGTKRQGLEDWFAGPVSPRQLFAGRVLAFDSAAALAWGELMAAAERDGRPRDRSDAIIAAVATANRCVVVTRNTRDFPGSEILDPSQANVENSA